MTEAAFIRQVLQLARLRGWRSLHIRPALNQRGKWLTPLQGDGVGFPDLLLLRRDQQIVAELKVGRNTTTAAQEAWLAAFRAANVAAYVWHETDWDEIVKVLE